LFGGQGNDTLNGGAGNDTLAGGKGIDDFVFGNNAGNDTIRDFDALEGREDIDLGGVTRITSFADLRGNHMSQQGSDVIINDFNGTRIVLEDVRLNQLDAGDFLF
jgi:serralysin